MAVREVCTDLAPGVDPAVDPLLSKLKKDVDTGFKLNTARKQVVPSSSQVFPELCNLWSLRHVCMLISEAPGQNLISLLYLYIKIPVILSPEPKICRGI